MVLSPSDLMAQSDPFLTLFASLFELLKALWAVDGKSSPSAVYLFIESERLKGQEQAGLMKHDGEWKVQRLPL